MPVIEVTSSVRPSSSRTAIIRVSVSASLAAAVCQSGQQERDPLQRAGPVRDHPGRVGERGEQVAHDPQRRFLPAPLEDLAADGLLEPGRAEAPGAGQVAAVALADHAHRGGPGPGPERLLRGVQRRRPDALEQGAHLLDLGDHLDDQLLAAGTEVPQPAPRLIDRLRDVAAQLRGQPGDQHRVLLIGLVDGQVLAAPRPRGQRSAAHTRTASTGPRRAVRGPATGARSARTPPSPRRTPSPRPARRPSPARHPDPRPGTGTSTGQHLRVVITHHDHLLVVGQVDPDDRVASPAPARAAEPASRCGCGHPGTRHYRCPRTSSSCDGTPSPQRIRRTFLRPAPTRRTSFYAAGRVMPAVE